MEKQESIVLYGPGVDTHPNLSTYITKSHLGVSQISLSHLQQFSNELPEHLVFHKTPFKNALSAYISDMVHEDDVILFQGIPYSLQQQEVISDCTEVVHATYMDALIESRSAHVRPDPYGDKRIDALYKVSMGLHGNTYSKVNPAQSIDKVATDVLRGLRKNPRLKSQF